MQGARSSGLPKSALGIANAVTRRTENLEREWKFTTDLDFELPDLVGRVSMLPVQQLHTTYFDTPDLRLWESDITLRHREGERPHEGIWTLKLPSASKSGSTLDRTEFEWTGDIGPVPTEAMEIVRGLVRHSVVQTVAELSTERRRLVVHDGTGLARAEVDDDTVTVMSGRRDGRRFREIEIELDSGTQDWGRAVLKQLRRAGARSSDEPKLTKALGVRAGRTNASAKDLSKSSRIGDVVTAAVSDGLRRLTDHDYRIRLSPSDPDVRSIHQARVATRRLRSNLKSFGAVLDPIWVRHTRSELKRLGESLGKVRDVDVLTSNLVREEVPVVSRGPLDLREELEGQRRQASLELAEVMSGEGYLELLDRLYAASERPPFVVKSVASRRANQDLVSLVGRRWRALERRVEKAGPHPDPARLHKIRIRAKQLRYAAEAAGPVIGKPARRTAKASERLQAVLGDHHDAVEAQVWLSERELGRSAEADFTSGWLSARNRRAQDELAGAWRSVWSRLDHEKVTGWLDRAGE